MLLYISIPLPLLFAFAFRFLVSFSLLCSLSSMPLLFMSCLLYRLSCSSPFFLCHHLIPHGSSTISSNSISRIFLSCAPISFIFSIDCYYRFFVFFSYSGQFLCIKCKSLSSNLGRFTNISKHLLKRLICKYN